MTERPKGELTVVDKNLLRAAARLFRQRGFGGTSVREIAREADMLPGSVHYRYRTKELLLLGLMGLAVSQATAAIREAIDSTDDPFERLRMALRAHLRILLSGDDAAYVLLYETRMLTGEARERMLQLQTRYESLWDGLIYEAAGTGRLVPGLDLRLVRHFTFGAVNWAAQWFHLEPGRSPEEIADAFSSLIAYGVVNSPHRPEGLIDVFDQSTALSLNRGSRRK